MLFNLKTTVIYKAVLFGNTPLIKFRWLLRIIFLLLGFLLVAGRFVLIYINPQIALALYKPQAALIVLFFALAVFFWHLDLFFENKIKNPKPLFALSDARTRKDYFNLASFLDFNAARACRKALAFSKRRKLKTIPSFVLLYFILKQKAVVDFVFQRAFLKKQVLFNVLRLKMASPESFLKREGKNAFEKIILHSLEKAQNRQKDRIALSDILAALSLYDKSFFEFLNKHNLSEKEILELGFWYERIIERARRKKKFWLKENLNKQGSLASDFASGYTLALDRYSIDLREKARKQGTREIIGHKKEADILQSILERAELNNVLLIGEPGSGRKSIIDAVLQKAFFGETSDKLKNKRFLTFDIAELAAQYINRAEFGKRLDECLLEAVRAGNVVLVINDFHTFISGDLDISAVLSRYLSETDFQVVAITSFDGWQKIRNVNSALLNMFEAVEAGEINNQEALEFLQGRVGFFERKYRIFITYQTLKVALKLSSLYLKKQPLPESALRLLDESAASLGVGKKEKVLLQAHIENLVSEKTGVPIGQIAEKEKYVLLNLENLIHQRIINQTEAVSQIANGLRRARAEVNLRYNPSASFLFLGPTGVGKTETAKALANVYFQGEKNIIRLDMSEFQASDDVKRLLGFAGKEGILTSAVRERPFSLILLDELEKASPDVLNIFLQILDEGFVSDGLGRRVDFQNTIIIATSNAGSELIRQDLREDKVLDIVKTDLIDYLLKENIFKPEFLNRFDEIVVFKPLTKDNLLSICHLLLNQIESNLLDKGIIFEITSQLLEKIVELSYNVEFGAREMKRVIKDRVENLLAKALIEGRLKRGKQILIEPPEDLNKQFILKIFEKQNL